ncbi:Cyclase-like protein 2, partial [Glycine soja]
KEWDTSYVGFIVDGAKWLVDNTDIKLVGIDYLSVASYDYLIPSHLVFLKDREIILVEGLTLDDVPAICRRYVFSREEVGVVGEDDVVFGETFLE